jgi:hypothetical protein
MATCTARIASSRDRVAGVGNRFPWVATRASTVTAVLFSPPQPWCHGSVDAFSHCRKNYPHDTLWLTQRSVSR